jgi:hypothetical protein
VFCVLSLRIYKTVTAKKEGKKECGDGDEICIIITY